MYFPYVGSVLGANDRINVACVGVNGKGDSDSHDAALCGGNIVAICDVDKRNLARKIKRNVRRSIFPDFKPKMFQDYRQLLDTMGKEFDAITVSTPDHHHGYVAIRAMSMGKHAFCCRNRFVQTSLRGAHRPPARQGKISRHANGQSGQRGRRLAPRGGGHPGWSDR